MSPYQLLTPRVLAIGTKDGTPNDTSRFWVSGQIIEFGSNMPHVWINGIKFTFDDFMKYPHLFRKLEWWEYRTVNQMPEFVKSDDVDGFVVKVKKWLYYKDSNVFRAFEYRWLNDPFDTIMAINGWIPATLEEYDEYQKSKQ